MNGFAERPRVAGAGPALGCLAGLAYGAGAAAFFFDRYSVVRNVYPPPRRGAVPGVLGLSHPLLRNDREVRGGVSETRETPPLRLMALTRGGFKLIHDFYSGTNLLYNAEEDPRARRDLAAEPARAAKMQRGLFDLKSYLEFARASRRAERGNR